MSRTSSTSWKPSLLFTSSARYLGRKESVKPQDWGGGGPVCVPPLQRSPGVGEGPLDAARQPLGPGGFPEEPELEAVHPAAALQGLVPRVVGDVVKFIGLEEVRGAGTVAALEEALGETAVSPPSGVVWGRPTEGKGLWDLQRCRGAGRPNIANPLSASCGGSRPQSQPCGRGEF